MGSGITPLYSIARLFRIKILDEAFGHALPVICSTPRRANRGYLHGGGGLEPMSQPGAKRYNSRVSERALCCASTCECHASYMICASGRVAGSGPNHAG